MSVCYVDQSIGKDTNPGIETAPWRSIQRAVNAGQGVQAGDTVLVKSGVYREFVQVQVSGQKDTYVTIKAYPGDSVYIKGSDVISNWKHDGGNIYNHEWVPAPIWVPWDTSMYIFGISEDETNEYKNLATYEERRNFLLNLRKKKLEQGGKDILEFLACEQVFVDGKLLKQVFYKNDIKPGTFYVDELANQLFIQLKDYTDPNTHIIEASARDGIFHLNPTSEYLRVIGFKMCHATNPPQAHGPNPKGRIRASAVVISGKYHIFEDNEISWMNGLGLLLGGNNHVLRRNFISHNGHLGIGSNHSDNHLLEENDTSYNGWRSGISGWEHGGMKICVSNGWKIFRHRASFNRHHGIWFDNACNNNQVCKSYLFSNCGAAIHLELVGQMGNNEIVDNLIYNNGKGIMITSSDNTKVHHNIIHFNIVGIDLILSLQERPKTEKKLKITYQIGSKIQYNIVGLNVLANVWHRRDVDEINQQKDKIDEVEEIFSGDKNGKITPVNKSLTVIEIEDIFTKNIIIRNLYFRGSAGEYYNANKLLTEYCTEDDLTKGWGKYTWDKIKDLIQGKNPADWSIVVGVGWTTIGTNQPFKTLCPDLASWQSFKYNKGQDNNSIQINPQFINPKEADFRLRPDNSSIPSGIGLQQPPICMPEIVISLKYEYVTGATSLLKGDSIGVHIVNDSNQTELARVVIYQNIGAGASVVADSGIFNITSNWTWGLGYTLSDSGEYWLRIQVSSQFLVPKASFERYRKFAWIPFVTYHSGEFAIFKLQPFRDRVF